MSSFHFSSNAKRPSAELSCSDKGESDSLAAPASLWLMVALEEYKALRAEIIESIQAQRTILQLGVTGISALIGLGLYQAPSLLASTILAVLVPFVTFFITTAAWGELFRAARASSFLSDREVIINEEVKSDVSPPAMAWESWLRRQPISTWSTDGQFFGLYTLTVGGAIVGSVTMFTMEVQRDHSMLVLIGIGAISVLMCAGSLLRYKQLRRRTAYEFHGATS